MIRDLYMLEQFYGAEEAAQFLDVLMQKYKEPSVKKALQAGHLKTKCLHCGPSKGKYLVWLSDLGKIEAASAT